MGYSYRYDQLNRLKAMNHHRWTEGATGWSNSNIIEAYKEKISYDGNGNILSYLRNGADKQSMPLAMDNLEYVYNRTDNRLVNNKLRHVKEDLSIPSSNYTTANGTEDLENQPNDNYTYDRIGNLTGDQKDNIQRISWTVYGKIARIEKVDGSSIAYGYDASGNRITKTVTDAQNTSTTNYYVRDAQGNVLGVYSDKPGTGFAWQEQHLYGSSRLGMALPNFSIATGQTLGSEDYTSTADPLNNGVVGLRRYELSNHLGNVLSVISDRAIGHDAGNGTIDYYTAEVLSAQDYYPFGMGMPGRKWNSSGYRFGFNGKESDNKDGVIQYDYGFRIYDPRNGRFLSTDPLMGSYPWYTPYQFAGNTPIQAIDLDGLEEAYPRQAPKIPVLTNVSESTCQDCPVRSAQIHRMQQKQAIENLRAEYQSWRRQPGNITKPVPSKYVSVVPKPGPEAVLTQGGYMGSDEYKITKARYDQTKDFLPVISDINDAYQSYEFGKKGQYGMMALSLVSLVPGADFITKPLKFAGKYADEAAKLVKHSGIIPGKKEILTITKTGLRTDAYKVATATIGDLGDNAIPLMGKSTSKYPDANKIVVGMQSADGSRGWRIDFDSEKGAHYNWFNNNTGEKGAVFFEGTADQVHYLKQQMTKSF